MGRQYLRQSHGVSGCFFDVLEKNLGGIPFMSENMSSHEQSIFFTLGVQSTIKRMV